MTVPRSVMIPVNTARSLSFPEDIERIGAKHKGLLADKIGERFDVGETQRFDRALSVATDKAATPEPGQLVDQIGLEECRRDDRAAFDEHARKSLLRQFGSGGFNCWRRDDPRRIFLRGCQ